MSQFAKFAAVAVAGLALAGPQVADSAPQFPIVLDGQDCVGAYCYNTVWTLEQNGTFTESYGLSGTYRYNPNYGNQGGLIMTYDPYYWPYVYYGARTNLCLSGPIRDTGNNNVGTFDACIVP